MCQAREVTKQAGAARARGAVNATDLMDPQWIGSQHDGSLRSLNGVQQMDEDEALQRALAASLAPTGAT